jgi:hypothetical protein
MLEVEAKMKEAYDELLTQKFNPDQEDLKGDVVQGDDDSTTTNQELALVSVNKGMFYSLVCTFGMLDSLNLFLLVSSVFNLVISLIKFQLY